MSGHSKWATTKRAKAVVDAKRAGAFTKVANGITIAAREKGGDPETNFSLRLAIEKAKAVNMPKDNIERAIKRGLGTLDGETLEEITYEGFGPAGVAVIISTVTNNRNRTASEIKHILSKHGGNLGAQNSVQWMFSRRGVIGLENASLSDDEELALIEAGAQDVRRDENAIAITTTPEALQAVKGALEILGKPIAYAEFSLIAKNTVSLDDAAHSEVERLVDELENHQDVTDCYLNLD